MNNESRRKKTLLNARVNLICYFAALIVAFFSRQVFFKFLGTEFIGLTGTIAGFLGFFNLAELGVGTAIAFLLYKPIYNGDKNKINELISVFGYLYRIIGIFILVVAIIFSFFLPLLFSNTSLSWGIIYFAYYAAIFNSLLGYFVNYPQILLTADQRNYEVTGYYQVTTIAQTIAQIILLFLVNNYYIFIGLQIIFSAIYSIILYWRINKVYPWLKHDIRLGNKLFKKYPDIKKNTKQIFVHTLGGYAHYQLMPILIYKYVSLPMVALYSNYTMIGGKFVALVKALLGSTSAGVGNLIAEGNKKKVLDTFESLLAIDMIIAGTTASCIYLYSSSFISLWLGKQYILDDNIVLLVAIEYFLAILRATLDQFLRGSGLYSDIWAPAVETLLVLLISVLGGIYWGLFGILLGPIISTIIIVYLWKPYFLFSKGFHINVLSYWILLIKFFLSFITSYFFAFEFAKYTANLFFYNNGWYRLIVESIIFVILLLSISIILSSIVSKNFRCLVIQLIGNIIKKINILRFI